MKADRTSGASFDRRRARRAAWLATWIAGLLVAAGPLAATETAPPPEDPLIVDARMAVRTKQYDRAVALWRRAAAKGNVQAEYLLGIAYRSGRGVPRDLEKAERWLSRADRNGSPDARYALGMMYRNGLGVARSRDKAIELFERAAAAGHERAKRELDSIARSGSVAYAAADARVVANQRDPREALTQSIRTLDVGSAREALARGAPIDGAPGDTKHWRPLVLAIDRGSLELVTLLLEQGADPNVRSRDGEAALVVAIRGGKRAVVRALLSRRAQPSVRAKSGYSALMVAAQAGDEGIVRDLLRAGADASFVLDGGTSAASVARRFGHEAIYRRLVRAGSPSRIAADRMARSKVLGSASEDDSMPPVVEAARRGDAGLLQEMVDRRVDLTVRDVEGETALTRAAIGGHAPAIEVLVAAGVDPNVPGASGITALMRAMESTASGADTAFAALLEAGADVHARDARGRAAFDFSFSGATPDKLERLRGAGGSWTSMSLRVALEAAVVADRIDAVDALYTHTKTRAERTAALCRAIEQGSRPIVGFLLMRSTRPDGDCGGGATPIAIAVGRGDAGVVAELLEAGADADAGQPGVDTPLIVAASRGADDLVAMLVETGVDVDRRGAREMTALMTAAGQGHADVVRRLLDAGADKGMRNSTDLKAIELARQVGANDVVTTIESHDPGLLGWLGGR